MVTLIVVDYNSIDKTIDYIKHVASNITNRENLNLIIIENGDSSTNEKKIREKCNYKFSKTFENKKVLFFQDNNVCFAYCYSGGNVGYAIGNNLGAKISDKFFNSDYYIFSNNDLLLKKALDFEKVKRIFADHPEIALLGPRVIGLNGKDQSPNRRLRPVLDMVLSYWFNIRPYKWKGDLDYTGESKTCFRISGCFMIADAHKFKSIGGFDEGTFLYAEEMIISERLIKNGYYCYFWNDYSIIHNHGETVKNNSKFLQSEKWLYKSCMYYFEKYRNINPFIRIISRFSFEVYKLRRWLRYIVKKCYRIIK